MKRPTLVKFNDQKTFKKPKQSEYNPSSTTAVFSDENLLHEILKHADARTLATAACINRKWNQTAEDERLWEQICIKLWGNVGCRREQLRIVVLALGGFRCLYSNYLLPLSKPSVSIATSSSPSSCCTIAAATSASVWPCTVAPAKVNVSKSGWGKDEIQLSLSLLSVRYFGKLKYGNGNK